MGELFDIDLKEGEKILWSGQPEIKVHFTKSDLFLIPFSLMWCTISIIWEVFAITIIFDVIRGGSQIDAITFIFPIFGVPFVVVGLYFVFGRFMYKNKWKQNAFYVITNQRVIVINKRNPNKLQEAYINLISTINKSIRKDGIGTIRFGVVSIAISMYANTGLDLFGQLRNKDVPTFHDIVEAEKVYQLVKSLKVE